MTDKIIILKNVWSNYQFLEMLGLWRGENNNIEPTPREKSVDERSDQVDYFNYRMGQ